MADLKLTVDSSDIQVMRRELVGVAKDAKASASVFEREYAKAERQLRASASSAQKYYAEVYRLDGVQKSAAQSASVFEKELIKSDRAAKTLAATKDRLASKYKPLYAQSKLYERSLEEINQANKLGVLTDKEREATVQRLNQQFATGTGVFSTYANGMTKGSNRLGVAMQQTGYQVGDFLVQVQSGTNPMVAFGQQATQLVGVMYLLPQAALAAKVGVLGLKVSLATITLGLSIAIPLLTAAAAAFMRLGDGAKKASSDADEYADALERIIQKQKDLRFERLSLTTNFDEDALKASARRAKLADRIAELELLQVGLKGKQLEGNKRLVGTLQDMMSEESRILSAALAGVAAEEARVLAIKSAAEKTKDVGDAQVKAYQDYQTLVKESKKSQKDELALALAINRAGEDGVKVAELRAEQEGIAKGLAGKALKNFVQMEMIIRGVVVATEETADALEKARGAAFDIGGVSFSNIADGATWAGALADRLERARGIALDKAVGGNVEFFDPRGRDVGSAGAGRIPRERGVPKENRAGYKPPKPKGGGSKVVDINEIIEARKQQAAQERVLIGLSGQQHEAQKIYYELLKKNEDADIKLTETQLRGSANVIAAYEEQNRVLQAAEQQRQQLVSSIESSLEDGFMSMIDGTKSVKDAFRDMARDIIRELYRVLVVKKLVASVSSFFGFADGGAFSGGSQIQAYADGGVVGGPTFFPMAGNKTGLMGEAGPEAIMPLKRGANGKLGVQAEGGGGDVINISQSFNFQANGDDSVKKLIAQAAPQIANMTQKQIMDSRRRGGSMKAAFG